VTVVVDPPVRGQAPRPGLARRMMKKIETIATFAYHLLRDLF
jgi:hypothetical protein